MAEAFLQIALNKLTSLIEDKIGSILDADKEMKKLADTFTFIQAVVEDAELKQPESKPIQIWLIKLTDMLYEIDDILDECATHVSKFKHKKNAFGGRYNLKEILFRYNIGARIKEATKNLDAISADRVRFNLSERDFKGESQMVTSRETTSLLNEADQVLGREDETEKIVDILVNQVKENEGISTLPVIGVGGLGKTTLAQAVYNDPRVVDHFNVKMWVWVRVSDNFDLKVLVKSMIEAADGKSDAEHLDSLQRILRRMLNKKRFLLVLDDVWSDDPDKWSQLRNVLSCGSSGSSVIITTRVLKVAELMGTLPTFKLKGLSEEHCWQLLKNRAFRGDEEEENKYQNLKEIGKQIVNKCCGAPLAAKAVGGLLQFRRAEKEWIHVKDSKLWELPQEAMILPALRLSYHHLPLALRHCFAYCAIYPKDTWIEKKELILSWIAHGYISSKGTMDAEDVGEEVCKELILRSLLERPGYNFVAMHDLVHDLAESIMENKVPEAHIGSMSTSAAEGKFREVNFLERYVAFPKSIVTGMDLSSVVKKYNRLRVLNASYGRIQYLPSSIGDLKHLRSLILTRSNICTLPNSLCNLWNLEILNLDKCWELVALPKKMKDLKNLRHLFLESCYSLRESPPNIRELTSLKTMGVFIVGFNKGNQLDELECLDLGGHLEIQHLERVKNPIDAMKANLRMKRNLSALTLVWEANNGSNSREDTDEKILEALQPFPNLRYFGIVSFSGKHLSNLMKESAFGGLSSIEIKDCQNLLDLSHLKELPLEDLTLQNLAIEYIVPDGNAHSTYFPSLKRLTLSHLRNMKGLFKEKVGCGMSPNLLNLRISHCPSLVWSPLISFNKLDLLSCDDSSILASFSKLDNLIFLDAIIGKRMTCIRRELLEPFTNLRELGIDGAHDHCFPIEVVRGLNSLVYLRIFYSEALTCLPMGWLLDSTLQILVIKDCSKLVEIPEEIKNLQFLTEIYLGDLPKIACLPESIRHLSTLKRLTLSELPQLTSLPDWLGDLTSLDYLKVDSCPNLASLPTSIQVMTNLKYLEVVRCPHLERRCRERKGEDWPKIAHIPSLYFGWH